MLTAAVLPQQLQRSGPVCGRFPDNSSVERLNLTYGYLANGRVSSVTDTINPGQSVSSYEYDQLNRLTKATTPNWALQWTYDEFGNRLNQTKVPGSAGTPPEITLSYGESTNRITTAGYTYDLNGNLTALPGLTVAYDVFDRAVTTNSTTAKYDAFGRRIERVVSGLTKIYFYDMGGRLLAEYISPAAGQNAARRIEYFAGQSVGDYTDRTGNVRFTVYAGGGAWRHYYPFGEEITGTANDTYKFADLYRDADTGLDYAMARYYTSGTGRFLTPDPYSRSAVTTNPASWNRYAYVLGDPVNLSDPLGLDPEGRPVLRCEINGSIYFGPICELLLGELGEQRPREGRKEITKEEWKQKIDEAIAEAESLITEAYDVADEALEDPDCAGAFGATPDEARGALNAIVNGKKGPITGKVKYAYHETDSRGSNWAARTGPSGSLSNFFGLSDFVITINAYSDDKATWWNTGNATENAATLIHELGHVFRFRGRTGGGFIQNDDPIRDPTTGFQNRSLILEKCFGIK